jgi:hypothetical protein
MDDAVLTRITFEPETQPLQPIPWPQGLAPTAGNYRGDPTAPLPPADVLVVTWTAAEWRALADVLTPGHATSTWARYREGWSRYESQLTNRSPARDAGCLADVAVAHIGDTQVLCVHSQLHLATDGPAPPIVELWQQIVTEVKPQLVITTGTAGGIGASTSLGDVFVTSSAKFNCTKGFASKPWAQERYVGPGYPGPGRADTYLQLAEGTLITANAGRLQPVATRAPKISVGGDVETIDFFGFDDTDDSYGVVRDDPQAHTEEMDDATLPLALSTLSPASTIPWVSVRNASDPEVSSAIGDLSAQKKWASDIYKKYGYWTSVASAITCWAIIAGLSATTDEAFELGSARTA